MASAPTHRSAPVRATDPPPETIPHAPTVPLFDTVTTVVWRKVDSGRVLKAVCPKGVSVDMQQGLAEVTLDAASLTGMCSNDALQAEKVRDTAKLAAAIRGTGEAGARPMASIWK